MRDWHPVAKWCGYAGSIAIVITSLMPAPLMPDPGIPDWSEHLLAYAGTSFLLCAAFRARVISVLSVVLLLTILAGSMEMLQHFSPGRSASLSDFLFGTGGAAIGAALAVVITDIALTVIGSGTASSTL